MGRSWLKLINTYIYDRYGKSASSIAFNLNIKEYNTILFGQPILIELLDIRFKFSFTKLKTK